MKKQPEITEKTRQNLLDAYWCLYREKPQAEITVQKVADKAGYNRSTFYAYFNSLQDIHKQMEKRLLKQIEDNVTQILLPAIMNGGMPNLSKLYPYFAGDYLRVMLKDNSDSCFAGRLKRVLRDVFIQFLQLQPVDKKTEYILEFIVSGVLAVLTRWYDKADLAEEEAFELVDTLLRQKTPIAYFAQKNST